ncbi:response regulator transcription factor [Salsuginibacillus halophilus]|nr:response regulator [Salsuginibacillus halophilus]
MSEAKVLVCDDSALIRKKFTGMLENIGCAHITEAANGQESVERFQEINPHLVFLDIVMPEKDGLEALADMVEHNPKARVIIVSSAGTQTHVKQALDAGAVDFIQKPADEATLKKMLDKELQKASESPHV